MRKKIWKILKDLENGKATTNESYNLLCDLFALSSSVCSCGKLPDGEIAISSKALQKPYGDLGQTDF